MADAIAALRRRLGANGASVWRPGYAPKLPPLLQVAARVPWLLHLRQLVASHLGRSPWSAETLEFAGGHYPYFDHRYNLTWLNERRAELALAIPFLTGAGTAPVLEVGRVMGPYGYRGHVVVDRYEMGPGVLNVDICDYQPGQTFRRILSVSTLEHVGWDEPERDLHKALRALELLVSLLATDGSLLVTIPAGYHPRLGADVLVGGPPSIDWRGLIRVDRANHWREVAPSEALARAYGAPFLNANGLLVGRLDRTSTPSAA